MIEQVCGKQYDEVCEMKYAVMRTRLSDFYLAQLGMVIKNFPWDYEKKAKKRRVEDVNLNENEAFIFWTEEKNLGRGFKESYASRFSEIWELGLRKFPDKKELYQTLGETSIYEMVVSHNSKTYNSAVEMLKNLRIESDQRDKTGILH